MENYYPELYLGSVHILVAIALFCSLLLWSQREDGQRSRRFLAWTWLLLWFLYMGRLLLVYRGRVLSEGVLPINILVFGMFLVAIMMIYPIEVVVPRWLNRKRLLVLFFPVLVVFAVYGAIRFWGGGFRMLDTVDDIARYWYEPNVWMRFVLILIIYGYAFILYYIPQNKMRGNSTLSWIRAYTFGNMGIALLYMGMILFGAYPTGIFHTLYFSLYVGYITYQELYLRLFIPDSENMRYTAANREANVLGVEAEKALWARLEKYMRKQMAWHNPNLSICQIAKAVGATHVEIARLLELRGYDDFDDYVAGYRIREFCGLVDKGDTITIEDTFFKVGFRYRDIASKHFMRIMHQTPEEYIQKGRKPLLINK